ncbi:14514_t:CDS:2, partial [Ambispora leptoticha]
VSNVKFTFTETLVAALSMDDESNNVKIQSGTTSTTSMKRYRRKGSGSISSNVPNRRDSKDKIHGSINLDFIADNNIGEGSSTVASNMVTSDSTVKKDTHAYNLKKENNNGGKESTSNQSKKTSNTNHNDNTRVGVEALPPLLPTSLTPIEVSLPLLTERTTTIPSSRTNKICAHCGDNARDGGGADTRLLCINCNGMVNVLLSDGSLNNEDVYWQHVVTRRRKYSRLLWGETSENCVKLNVLDGMIPTTKRQRWIKRFESD